MGSYTSILALLLVAASIAWAQNPSFNDAYYPTLGHNDCPDPTKLKCTPDCGATATPGTEGHYTIPARTCPTTGPGSKAARATYPSLPYCIIASTPRWQCCSFCVDKTQCAFWQHFKPPNSCTSPTQASCGSCWIYPPTSTPPACVTLPVSWTSGGVTESRSNINGSTIGIPCSSVKNDPHFQGAHGTRFEFNGFPDESFCLLTDRLFHVNMRMRGYYDTRTVGASILKNGKAVRTWIRELGVLWTEEATGAKHSLRLAARDGKSSERGDGYLKDIEFDGQLLPRLKVGESYTLAGGLTLDFVAHEKTGGGFFDVDAYRLRIGELLDLGVKLRVAHPLLQTPDDAQAHINVHFNGVERSSDVHGVMGQTYREGRQKRAIDYSALSLLAGRPFAADSEEGKGFLDGSVADYRATGVLQPDCRFSAYDGRQLPAIAPYRGVAQ